jgi:hypothetical protein
MTWYEQDPEKTLEEAMRIADQRIHDIEAVDALLGRATADVVDLRIGDKVFITTLKMFGEIDGLSRSPDSDDLLAHVKITDPRYTPEMVEWFGSVNHLREAR